MTQDKKRPPRLMGGGRFAAAMAPTEKAKDFRGTFGRLAAYLRPRVVKLAVVVLLAMLSTGFNIVSPRVMGLATTRIFEGVMDRVAGIPDASIDFAYVGNILLVLAGLYIVSSLFAFGQQYLMADVAQRTVYQLRREVKAKLARLPLRYFDSQSHGEILSRVTNDVDTISSSLQQSMTQLITAAVTLLGILVMMLLISPTLTLVVLFILPASVVVTRLITKRSRKYFSGQQKNLGELNGHVEEMLTGHSVIKAFGREDQSISVFNEVNDRLYDTAWKAQFMSGLIMPMMNLINNMGYVLFCVAGGIYVARGLLPIGEVQALIQYSKQFTQPIAQTASIANILQSTMAAAERVFEVLDETEEQQDSADAVMPAAIEGAVAIQSVDFAYKPEAPLFKGLSIDVQSGDTVAIVGPTGAGKTTLVNLLMRFYEVQGGKITIDGTDIRDFPRGGLRSVFGMVLQDTWLFNGTIRDNIAYGRPGAEEEEIMAAARAAHADHFIRTLPDGYGTILNEEASNISQGQKQLLTIARAVLADPAILILDEATSSVDTRTEVLIQEAMSRLMQGRTSFVIAHRLSTIRNATVILVMNEGQVVETGSHQQLMDSKGFYADLYNSQFAGAMLDGEAV